MNAESECRMCGRPTDELCPDEVCRACHVSISFEDCCEMAIQRLAKATREAEELWARNGQKFEAPK